MTALIETKPALRIGPYEVDPPVVLAPMAGITNVAFRVPIPRHNELGEKFAVDIFKECQDVLGQGWWRK